MNKSKRKPPNYWSDWSNIVSEIKFIIVNDRFPTTSEIRSQLGNGACKAISKFGGIGVVSSKMGYKITSMLVTSDGHYVRSSYEYIVDEFLYENNIQHEVDGIIHPSRKYCYDFKINDWHIEIWGYDIKNSRGKKYIARRVEKEKFYKDHNLKLISIEASLFKNKNNVKLFLNDMIKKIGYTPCFNIDPKGCTHHFEHWNYDNTLNELKKAIVNFKHFPTYRELINYKKGFVYGIKKHGGINIFRKLLGHPIKSSGNLKWNSKTITVELKTIIKDIGHFPTCTELKLMKKTGLLDAITNLGGINKFRKDMGYSITKNYTKIAWTSQKIEKELGEIIKNIDHFPTCDELKSMKKFGLLCASYNFGGINKFRKNMGHPILKRGPKSACS